MDYCNGLTHSWSDDSYSCGSYPCPGPVKCADAAHALKTKIEKETEVTKLASNVSIKVMIPVTTGGYTGQRDAWEQRGTDQLVTYTEGIITIKSMDSTGRMVQFRKADLDAALRALGMHAGPVYREPTIYRNTTGDAVGSQ